MKKVVNILLILILSFLLSFQSAIAGLPIGSFGSASSSILPTVSSTPLAVYATKCIWPGYTGPIFRIRSITTTTNTLDISCTTSGLPDISGVSAFLGSDIQARVDVIYDQMDGSGTDAVQATQGSMPFFTLDRAIRGQYSITFDGTQNSGNLAIPAVVTGDSRSFTATTVISYSSTNAAMAAFQLGANWNTAGSTTMLSGQGASSIAQILTSSTFVSTGIRTRAQIQPSTISSGDQNMRYYVDDRVATTAINNVGTWVGGFIGRTTVPYSYNGEWYALVVWPTELSATEISAVHRSMNKAFDVITRSMVKGKIIFSGNSIVQGTASLRNQNYPRQCEAALSKKVWIYNSGVFGQLASAVNTGIAGYTGQFDSTFTNNYFVLIEPTNDIGTSAGSGNIAAPSTAGGGGSGSVGTNVFNNWTLPNILSLQTAGFTVFVPTTLARVWAGSATDKTQREAAAADWRNLVISNAGTYGYNVIDYNGIADLASASNATYFADGTHPTTLGYTRMATLCASTFNPILAANDNDEPIYASNDNFRYDYFRGTYGIGRGTGTVVKLY